MHLFVHVSGDNKNKSANEVLEAKSVTTQQHPEIWLIKILRRSSQCILQTWLRRLMLNNPVIVKNVIRKTVATAIQLV